LFEQHFLGHARNTWPNLFSRQIAAEQQLNSATTTFHLNIFRLLARSDLDIAQIAAPLKN